VRVIHVLRKPLGTSVTASVLEHGTGALNILGARVPHTESVDFLSSRSGRRHGNSWGDMGINDIPHSYEAHPAGRWPSNLVLGCEEPAAPHFYKRVLS
jgi:hypothetical protein